MTAPGDELTPINVVPHFSRLHEWVALEEGYFRDEGPEPNMLTDVMHSVSSHRGDEYGDLWCALTLPASEELTDPLCLPLPFLISQHELLYLAGRGLR